MYQDFSLPVRRYQGAITSALLLSVFSFSTSAQDGAENTTSNIEEVVVHGDRNLSRSTSIGKLDVPVTETPFSISIRSKDLMDAMGVKTIQDSLLYLAGVNGGTYGVDVRGDWSTIRGVDPTIYIDGLQSLYGNYAGARAPTYAFERVEVLKGPSSVLYGQGSTGGVVNLVSKRARPDAGGEMMVQFGSYDHKVIAGDYGGALDADGKWLYRVVAYFRDADAQVEHTDNDSMLLMPSISWRPSDDTDLTFLYSRQADESGTTAAFLPWQGTLLANPNGEIPTDTFISEPGWDKYDTDQDNYSLWFQHRFNPVFSINANARYSDGRVDYNSMWGLFTGSPDGRFNADQRSIARAAYASDAESEMLIADLRALAEFNTGIVEHMLSFGVDSLDAKQDNNTWRGDGGVIDVFNPIYGNIPTGYSINDNPYSTLRQTGIYAQDQMNIGKWIVNVGLRRDDLETKSEGARAFNYDANTKRFGVMYAFDIGLTPYISYTESFEPTGGTNRLNVPYKPIRGEQVEYGIKYQPPGSNVLVTLTRYDIEQENRLTPDPVDPNFSVQSGDVAYDGIELEVSANWEHFDLIANYSKADYGLDENGRVLQAVPEVQYSIWGSYRFYNWVDGLYANLGLRHVGESETGIAGYQNPDYTLVDAAIGYNFADWSLQVNANNLTDEVHTTSCISRGDCFYGERRYFTAEARYTF